MKAMEARALANRIIGNMEDVIVMNGINFYQFNDEDAKLVKKYIEIMCKGMRMQADHYFEKQKDKNYERDKE